MFRLFAGVFCLCGFLLGSTVSAQGSEWIPFDKAMEKAAVEEKNIFLYLYSPSCPWCHKMDEVTLQSPEVRVILRENFIRTKVNISERKSLIRQFQIQTIPASIFLSPQEDVLVNYQGYLTPERFLEIVPASQP
ncbi:thioredoxin family protein [Desulfobotulus sp. H1]|uniref:Thioredoxin family protein n=1 Tax=Desulfobotulus pelophilus TaxID=2823377 RepID=A0ABT3N5A3_9BACT|nr:thioredoxin family protein [Desulfobotulus pelophilus]MCW7752624.1 thioredoxin family protein [Desulfobotulus pelophilus]